jgi:hypothetical protein
MKNLNKFKKFAVLFSLVLSVSCTKDDIGVQPEKEVNNKEIPVSEPITFNYKYNYKGQVYSEKQWDDFTKINQKIKFSVIGLNDILYAFDNVTEANSFDKELQSKLKSSNGDTLSTTSKASVRSSCTVIFSLDFYVDTNYSGARFTIYMTQTVRQMRTWWGWVYNENNKFEGNLPSWIDNNTSSFKGQLIQGGSLLSANGRNYVEINMKLELRTEPLVVPGNNTNYTISRSLNRYYDTFYNNANFADNRLIFFSPVTWNDQPSSWKVTFL